MKVCYVDESGNTTQDPCLVMVGILVDSLRLHRTQQEFAEVFDIVQGLFQENLRELKGSKMILGRDRWRKVDPDVRKQIAGYFCNWIAQRKHRLILTAVDRAKLKENKAKQEPAEQNDEWLAAGLHVALQIQKANQTSGKHKGHTFLIFDDNKVKADKLSDLLWKPPAWTDDYYGRTGKQAPLDQIIDTTFSIKSYHAGLVQVADLFAFIFRRYAEIEDYGVKEEWTGEKELIDEYVESLAGAASSQACAMADARAKRRRQMVQRCRSALPEGARMMTRTTRGLHTRRFL